MHVTKVKRPNNACREPYEPSDVKRPTVACKVIKRATKA